MLLNGLLTVLGTIYIVDVVSSVPANNASLAFVAKNWLPNLPPGFPVPPNLPKTKMVFNGIKLIIDCSTNDPDAEVTLLQRQNPVATAQNSMDVKGGRMTKRGQTFVIDTVNIKDSVTYECTASNAQTAEIVLVKGHLNVNLLSIHDPIELWPSGNPLLFHEDSKTDIKCGALGFPGTDEKQILLRWYKLVNGQKVLQTSVLHRDEKPQTNTIDYVDLLFNKFSRADEGLYICERKLGDHTKEMNVTVKMKEPYKPKVKLLNKPTGFFSTPSGSTVSLTCELEGSPPPSKYWMKGESTIYSCPQDWTPKCNLVLRNVARKDNGDYFCTGQNKIGRTRTKLELEVTEKPVLEKPTTTVAALYVENKELTCSVQVGNPSPTVKWQYQVDTCESTSTDKCEPLNDAWIDVDEQTPESDTPTMKSKTVSKATQKNHFYRCIANNKVGQDVYNFKVIRTPKSEAQFSFFAEATTVMENSKLTMSCIIDSTKYKAPTMKKTGSIALPVVSTSGENNIVTYVYSKPITELTDAGTYVCEAENQRGTNVVNQTVTITIDKLIAPVINGFDDATVSQDEKQNLRLLCNATGNPTPKVTWEHGGKSLTKIPEIDNISQCKSLRRGIYRKKRNDKLLIICRLNYVQHAGRYVCRADNTLSYVTEEMTLTVTAKPSISDLPDMTFGLGEGGEIFCTANAYPPANVTWERLKVNATSGVKDMGVQGLGKSNLVFPKLSTEDGGEYRCTATNKYGTVSKTTKVFVKGITGGSTGSNQKGTIIGIVVAFVVLFIIIIIFVCWYKRHLKKKYAKFLEPNENFVLDPDRTLFDQSNDLPYDMAWEFPRERLTFIKTLGSGAFGQVWLAEAEGLHGFKPRENTPDARRRRKSLQRSRRYHSMSFRYKKQGHQMEVSLEKMMAAVKTLKDGAAEGEYKDLASELKILIHLGEHKNIVNLLGACTTNGKLCVILECCPHGSLLNFLRSKREIFIPVWAKHEVDMDKECSYIDLAMTAWQVAKGMDFLQTKKLIHRDLAARNVLVGEDYIMKIADFGLARDIYKDEFYLKNTTGLLPVKWMAPESIFDRVYTTSSDVWSFGILLWEIFTLGGSPYPGLPTENLRDFLESGRRMDCPEKCPKDIYEIMMDCWAKSPYERPLFSQVAERLNNCMKQNIPSGHDNQYLDFNDGQQDNYLQPEGTQAKSPPPEYLQSNGGHGNDDDDDDDIEDNLKDGFKQPLLAKGGNDYLEDSAPLPPVPSPPTSDYPSEEARYVSDDHYKIPKSNAEIV